MRTDDRSAAEPPPVELHIDRRRGVAVWRGGEVVLRAKTWDVLLYFAGRRGELISPQTLRAAVWSDVTVAMKTVHNVVAELRQALYCAPGEPAPIQTVKRRGYRFVAAVVQVAPALPVPLASGTPRPPPDGVLLHRPQPAAQLYAAWRGGLLAGTRIGLLLGEPGAGKSTVLRGFLDTLAGGEDAGAGAPGAAWPLIALGCCADRVKHAEPYGPLLMALGAILATRPSTVATLRRLAPTWLLQFPGLLDAVELEQLQRVCAGSAPARRSREGVALFEALAAEDALVLAIEDIHWADADTLDVLTALARMARRVPLFVVATLRRFPTLARSAVAPRLETLRRLAVEIEVPRFTPDEVLAYLRLRLADDAIAPDLAALLEERSSGNPLVLHSLCRQMIEHRQLQRTADGWRLDAAAPFTGHALSTAVTTVIAAQLHGLAAELLPVLEAGSLIGEEFSVAALAEVLGESTESIERCIGELARQEIVRPTGGQRFGFAHAVHRQVVRDHVAAARRERLEAAIAQHLERRPVTPHEPFAPAAIAAHFAVAGEWERAGRYFEYAAHVAAGRLDYRGALRALETALACVARDAASPAAERREAMLRMLAANLAGATFDEPAAVTDNFRTAAALFDRHGCAVEAFRARLGLTIAHLGRGEYGAAEQVAAQLLAGGEVTDGAGAAACAYGALVALFRGDVGRAHGLLQRGLQAPVSADLPRLVSLPALMLLTSANVHALRDDAAAARRALADGLAPQHRHSLPVGDGFRLLHGALVACVLEDRPLARQLTTAAHELGERYGLARFRPLVAFFSRWIDDAPQYSDASFTAMEDALAEHRQIGSDWLAAHLYARLAESYLDAHRPADATRCIETGLAVADRSGDGLFRAELYRLSARCLLDDGAAGDDADAREALRQRAAAQLQRPAALAHEQGAVLFERRARDDLRMLALERTDDAAAAARDRPGSPA
jgi:DNA-binding winged helix-turn-helix (wHTH) protein